MLTLNVPSTRYLQNWDNLTRIVKASTQPVQAAIGFTEVDDQKIYTAFLIQEDGLTDGDGRLFVGPITWRDEPLPFTFSDSEGEPHEDARHVGNLINLRREMRGTESWVVADVDWDTDDLAVEAKRLVDEGRITGVSVHPTAAEGWMICGVPENPSADSVRALGQSLDEETWASCQEPILAFIDIVIGAATLLMLPAFDDAEVVVAQTQPIINQVFVSDNMGIPRDSEIQYTNTPWISPVFSPLQDSSGTAWPITENGTTFGKLVTEIWNEAVQASTSLDRPPKEWFDYPEPDEPTALTVTDDGQVYGHLAIWDTCHTGFQGKCMKPDPATDYSYFQTARVICADGSRIPVGPLVVDDGHASAKWSLDKVVRYYSDTRLAAAYVTIRSGKHGPWATGAVSHKATPGQVETLRRHALSGDWRKLDGQYRLIAAVSVNSPGFIVPEVLVASGEDVGMITYGPEPVVDKPSDLALVADALTRLTALIEQRMPFVDFDEELAADEAAMEQALDLEVEVALALGI